MLSDRVRVYDPNSNSQQTFANRADQTAITIMANGYVLVAQGASFSGNLRSYDMLGVEQGGTSGPLFSPSTLDLDSTGNVVVGDRVAEAIVRFIVDYDPNSVDLFPSYEILSIGGELDDIIAALVEPAGSIVALDVLDNQIIRVDAATGSQSVVGTSGFLSDLGGRFGGADLLSDGRMVVARRGTGPDDDGVVWICFPPSFSSASCDSVTGGYLEEFITIAVDSNDLIMVVVRSAGVDRLVRVDPNTREQTLVAAGGDLDFFPVERLAVYPGPPFLDSDGDGITDLVDNCPMTHNPSQLDAEGDGVGDLCDNCPLTLNADQADDGGFNTLVPDGIGTACQRADIDGDGVIDIVDEAVFRRTLAGEPPGFDPVVPVEP